jgi:hypothetical protein
VRVYLSNKMTGIPYFNAPWFDKAAAELLALPGVRKVFNPAEHDRKRGLDPMTCPNGHPDEARAAGGPPLRQVLGDDWHWIAHYADCVVVGPLWTTSVGAISEIACIQALRKPAYEFEVFKAFHDAPHLSQLALPPIMEL